MSVAPPPAPLPELPPGFVPATRLPDYFPVFVPKCEAPAGVFFACFEQHAVMASPTDTRVAKAALGLCQRELLGYTRCMEQHRLAVPANARGKPWWRVW